MHTQAPNLLLNNIQKLPSSLALVWFRKDLRLEDHHALHQALIQQSDVLPLFIFEKHFLNQLKAPRNALVSFFYQTLKSLQKTLIARKSSFLVTHGDPLEIFKTLLQHRAIRAVYANQEHEPDTIQRDNAIAKLLKAHHVPFYRYQDDMVFDKDAIHKPDGTPYTIYAPYMKRWKAAYQSQMTAPFLIEPYMDRFCKIAPLPFPTIKCMGFQPTNQTFPPANIDVSILHRYAQERNKLSTPSTTQISLHLCFGTISIRKAVQLACIHSEIWLHQLIWRHFFKMILAHFPHVVHGPFKPAYRNIAWRHDQVGFDRWCQGKTGYPIVDAGMRELNQTGCMHNRIRMIAASFLTKCLLIDWRWGEAYFAEKLLDYDLALNNGNWQWVAGCGCDRLPYFRMLSPERQTERFDPQRVYIKKWVPEHNTATYPAPIVDYKASRTRALEAYAKALRNQTVPKAFDSIF